MSLTKLTKLILFIATCAVLIGCSTAKYSEGGWFALRRGPADNGVRYLLGRGAPQDNEKAFRYFKQAADEDDPFAQNEVAYLFAAGKGTTPDPEKAFHYYQKAADHGLASAQYNLGLMYAKGIGTTQNKALAAKWFKKSSAHGFRPANQALLQYGDT